MSKNKDIETDKSIVEKDEIDLVEVAKTIWVNKKTILKSTLVVFTLGLIVAFGSGVEYEASCKILADNQEGAIPNLGGISGLAGLAGINLNTGGQGSISPDLYPEIVQSLPFQLNALNKELTFENQDTTVSSYFYFKELGSPSLFGYILGYTLGLPGKIKSLFKENSNDKITNNEEGGILRLTEEDYRLIKRFRKKIEVEVDQKTGIISVTTEMPDPMAAAELTQVCVDLLQEHVINYKISKAQENLKFVKERWVEARQRFQNAQENLALFNDRNQNVIAARAQTEQQRLQYEYNLAFEVYQGLATQLEQAEIKVKEDTPVFTIVEPVNIPIEKSRPKRKLIAIISILLGIFLGIGIIFLKHFISLFKKL